ncbi:hypothetical protein EYF80_026774 [Liparis tanakae]|uniref:Uncharacterized protein n=1 Tax=Liparis tanakae TaxID=230148 RepID=A0A4Z2HBA8_9TELE|nr:hypothetical protein EYF80_026774 [Liparis tanakae]
METWSLNNTGSSLIWECTRGMKPSQRLKAFMQLCRWAKWSGSAHREDLEPLVWRNTDERGGGTQEATSLMNPYPTEERHADLDIRVVIGRGVVKERPHAGEAAPYRGHLVMTWQEV